MKTTPRQIAEHEIAHAVMRKICWLPATRVIVSSSGGTCEGTSNREDADACLLVLLAGYAWEVMAGYCRIGKFSLTVASWTISDFSEAAKILERSPMLRIQIVGPTVEKRAIFCSVDQSLKHWFLKAAFELEPYRETIANAGATLEAAGELSAVEVGEILKGVKEGNKDHANSFRWVAYNGGARAVAE